MKIYRIRESRRKIDIERQLRFVRFFETRFNKHECNFLSIVTFFFVYFLETQLFLKQFSRRQREKKNVRLSSQRWGFPQFFPGREEIIRAKFN